MDCEIKANSVYQLKKKIDGVDTSGMSSSVIINKAEQLRLKAPQSVMYNIGYKGYSQEFFNHLSKNTAAKTIHLDNIDDLEEFYKDMSTINNCKVMYEFGSKGYAQCAAGDIFVTPFTVSENTSVNVAGESYNTGVEITD